VWRSRQALRRRRAGARRRASSRCRQPVTGDRVLRDTTSPLLGRARVPPAASSDQVVALAVGGLPAAAAAVARDGAVALDVDRALAVCAAGGSDSPTHGAHLTGGAGVTRNGPLRSHL
jgi:hypothetical protein